jgi:GxxExxY protein
MRINWPEGLSGATIEVHRSLGPGLLEMTYQQCLARELQLQQLPFEQEEAVGVEYTGLVIDQAYRADFMVADKVIVELKSVECVQPVHKTQLLTYLKWSNLKLGLLLNFNVPVMRSGITRAVNSLWFFASSALLRVHFLKI